MGINILLATSSFNRAHIPDDMLDILNQQGIELVYNPFKRRLQEHEISELLSETVGLLSGLEPLNRNVLQKAKQLQVISRCGIGTDNIDLAVAKELNIAVYNTPTAPVAAVAELTIALMIALLRKVVTHHHDLQSDNWRPQMGRLLAAQTVGIIGYGRIGRQIASLLVAFGANILVHDPYLSATDYQPHKNCELNYLLEHANMISLHIPRTAETTHLINAERIKKMRPGSFLINTARGGLIDEEALYFSLQNGHLAGAALDVFETEPYLGELRKLSNVIITPHIGSYAIEARANMEKEAMQNLIKGLQAKGIL